MLGGGGWGNAHRGCYVIGDLTNCVGVIPYPLVGVIPVGLILHSLVEVTAI